MPTDFNTSKTRGNLMRAFAGECQARTRYSLAAKKSKKMGYGLIENIFTITSNQEMEHAQIFYDHLKQSNGSNILVDGAYPVDNYEELEKLLRSSQHNEFEEYEKVYPSFAQIAKEEGFIEIARSFEQIAEIEKIHGERFECFAQLVEESKLFTADDSTEWICLNCGHIHKGPKVPGQCPVCQHPQGYFVPYKYYNFKAAGYAV